MYQIDNPTAVAVRPAATAAGTAGWFTDGNPGSGVPATILPAEFMNMLQAEFLAVLAAAGVTPDKTASSQVVSAIQTLITASIAQDYKASVRAATVGANITALNGGAPNTLDGVTLAANDRILVKDQTTASQNGIYVVSTLGTGSNGTWTRTTDADGAGELTSGAVVAVEEGSINSDSQWMLTTDGAITVGTTSLTFIKKDAASIGGSVQGSIKNLQASATGLSASVAVTADEIAVENSTNYYQTLRSVNLTINSAGSGANGLDTGTLATSTWYSVWVIWNGATQAGLLSLSATAPTMPSGYTHKARVGWIRTDASGNKYPLSFVQYGRRVRYKLAAGSNLTGLPLLASGASGSTSTPTWTSVAVGAFVPTTAASIEGNLVGVQATAIGNVAIVAPNNAYGPTGSTTAPPPVDTSYGAAEVIGRGSHIFSFLLESTNIYWASNAANFYLFAMGWEDTF